MTPQEALNRLLQRQPLSYDEMLELMRRIMSGEVTPAQIAGILVALRCKGESEAEIAAAAQAMREFSARVRAENLPHLVDTCGTGGDALHTFNISTASAFVAAAAGARVAKHGGRSVSSSCGSADVLEALGVNVNLTPEQVALALGEVGAGFMFAPNYHSAMKHAAPVRRELGVRTIFNILGPLTNPAGAQNQVIGVFRRDLTATLAQVLNMLGSRHVLVVHGSDGLDEITLSGETQVAELKGGEIREYALNPGRFGLAQASLAAIRVTNVEEAKAMLLAVLDNRPGAARDIVLLNSGAAIYVSGIAATLEDGVQRARAALDSGAARAKLAQLIEFGKRFKSG